MIIKNDYPILEYSSEKEAVINPIQTQEKLPRLCLVTFFHEVMETIIHKYSAVKIDVYQSEMKEFPIYRFMYHDIELGIVQAVVASGSIAMMTDFLYGKGVDTILCCRCCGALCDIPAGDVVLPIKALRDEGASYKYLPPSRMIELTKAPVDALKTILNQHQIPYIECITWTTDGFYRETKEMIEYRKSEGCQVVEMECATMASIAKYRNKSFGQLLYSGDILIGEGPYDDREWYYNSSAREKLVYLTLEALCLL